MDCKIAYLVSEYPGISHTFIFREISALRSEGLFIKTASIRRPAHLSVMTAQEKVEAENTFYIKTCPYSKIAFGHLVLLLKSPGGYFRLIAKSLALLQKGPKNLIKAIGYFVEAGILLGWLHRQGTKHVHVHFANPAATVAMLASFYGTITYSMSVHGPDIFYNVDTNLLTEKLSNSLFVRCISHFSKSQMMCLAPYEHWHKLHIIRCGIDPELYHPPEIESDNQVSEILCVGRLVPAKGQHILLEACSKLKKKGIDFHVNFIGDGEDRDSLESLAADLNLAEMVLFTGALGQDEVRRYYDRADIFVLPSFAEGVPVVLMEAMAKEIPVVSTRITGIPELIDSGKDGMLVAASNSRELAGILEELFENKELRQRLGKNGREKVCTAYNSSKNNRQFAELFLRILSPNRDE